MELEKNKYSDYKLEKYGRMRLHYLKEHKMAEYTILMMNNELKEHLYNTDIECKKQFDLLMQQYIEKENITEELKENSQMLWGQKMNCIKNRVEEILEQSYIFYDAKIICLLKKELSW